MALLECVPIAELVSRCNQASDDFYGYVVEDSGAFSVAVYVRYRERNTDGELDETPTRLTFRFPCYNKRGEQFVVMDLLSVDPSSLFWPPSLLAPLFKEG